ncbi:ADP-ribosylation factor 1-like [Saccostrea echinata]|uniref:ADP-ribosylation factor 1-like n=1 Tax=Saccostrea echinata TaxID=191078 RepID=UPI002A81D4C2|nr:ADP-ribosylation factor 1-like [Saccostrea echinata]XP_061196090.1 ADP-ribosylation factor 1-like [Saccostrea echinata]
MGNSSAKRHPVRIMVLGLYDSGKTSILHYTKLGEVVTTIPTIGFNVETLINKRLTLTGWDVGGRDKIRPLYRHYYSNNDALIFVVDSSDEDGLERAKEELMRHLSEPELQNIPLAIAFHKWDKPNHMTISTIQDAFGVSEIRKRRPCETFVTSVISDNGMELQQMLYWVYEIVRERRGSVKETQSTEARSVDFMERALAKLRTLLLN